MTARLTEAVAPPLRADVAASVAATYGTPAYVYDLARLRAAHADLRRALPERARLYYSLKANPHPRLVAELVALGCRAEVSSLGEIAAAGRGGAVAADLLLTGPGKSAELVGRALDHGVRRLSVDSPVDIARVGEVGARRHVAVECLLRVNADTAVPGMGMTMTGAPSQFGADASWVLREPARFRGHAAATVTGLHLYMGTNLTDEETLARQFEVAADVAARLRPALGGLAEVDLGGGFGLPYARAGERPRFPGLALRVAALLDDRLPGWRSGDPAVSFESGRYLVGDCGTLLTRVLDVKSSKGEKFVVLDTGVHHIGGMAGLRRLPPIVPSLLPVVDGPAREVARATVVGPLCTPLDTLVRGTELAVPRIGELVAIPNVGAYGLSASLLAFLGHPTPVEVVVDGGRVVEATRLRLDRHTVPTARRGTTIRNGHDQHAKERDAS